MFESTMLEEALEVLGELLASRRHYFEVVTIGGGSLLLLRLITRPTIDLDILARLENGELTEAEPLPQALRLAIEDTSKAMNLSPQWLNAGPAAQLRAGLPPGFSSRLKTRHFGKGLTLHIADRFDQICLKLFAAVDQGPHSKHYADLIHLQPTGDELKVASDWVRTQDASQTFRDELDRAHKALQERHNG